MAHVDPIRASALCSAYRDVLARVTRLKPKRQVRIVAVSKLKPVSDIRALHESEFNVCHFGENYAQELTEKAARLPRTVQWHFIGGLQSNKCKPLASLIPNLYCVSSVDSIKKATQLDKGRAELIAEMDENAAPSPGKLNIHIQLNTSSESTKSGLSPGAEVTELVQHVLNECPHLHLLGFMTIGAINNSSTTDSSTSEENPDFTVLRKERDRLATELKQHPDEWELSMGMSDDFEIAIAQGSGEVRVGSTLFGTRPTRDEFQIDK